ncbi:MAG: hypothetical protein R2854_26345 [Caldilineaceae bacterium]
MVDGDVAFAVTTSVASDDPVYAGITVDDIDAVNQDDDSAGIDVTTGVTTTTEAGGSFAISYTLTSAPTAAVVLTIASDDTGEATVAPAQLTFDAETWDQPQAVTVTERDDDVADGDVAFAVTTSVASDDPVYADFAVDDIDAVNQDDDSAGIAVSTGVTTTTEAGGSFAISYTLTSAHRRRGAHRRVRRHERSHCRARATHLQRRDVGPAPSRHRHRRGRRRG